MLDLLRLFSRGGSWTKSCIQSPPPPPTTGQVDHYSPLLRDAIRANVLALELAQRLYVDPEVQPAKHKLVEDIKSLMGRNIETLQALKAIRGGSD